MAERKPQERRRIGRSAMSADTCILVELPDGEERLEPVLDVSPTGVAVLVRSRPESLRRDAVLRRVRLFANGACTLHSRAVVRDRVEVTLPDGTPALKLGLSLEAAEAVPQATPAQVTYAEPAVIADAVMNLIHARAEAIIEVDTQTRSRYRLDVAFARAAADGGAFHVGIAAGGVPSLRRGRVYPLQAELFGTRMVLWAAYRDRRAAVLRFAWPARLTIYRHRQSGRLQEMPPRAEVELESPFVAERLRRQLVDLSGRGLAFVSDVADGMLVGMLLRSLAITLPDRRLTASGVVRNVRSRPDGLLVVGVELQLSDNARAELEEIVDRHFHPEIRPAKPADLRKLWAIYDAMAVFPRSCAAVSPVMGRIESTRQALLARGRSVLLAVVGVVQGEIHTSAELLRTYGTTWSLQHVGALPDAKVDRERTVLHLVQAATRREEVTHLHALLDPAASRDRLARLQSLAPQPDHLLWLWRELVQEPEGASPGPPPGSDLHEATAQDLEWVAGELAQAFPPLLHRALRLAPAELRLDETDRLYHAIGLSRRRLVRVAMGVGGPVGVALIEQTSPGACFGGLGDTIRLHVAAGAAAARPTILSALALDAARLQRQSGRKPGLFVVSPADALALAALGFLSAGPRIEVAADRDGATRLVNGINLLS
jgi:hypothetical protein